MLYIIYVVRRIRKYLTLCYYHSVKYRCIMKALHGGLFLRALCDIVSSETLYNDAFSDALIYNLLLIIYIQIEKPVYLFVHNKYYL